MTFSFKPMRWSTFPLMAASVRTLVVSWKEAAERKESVAKEALVIPMSRVVAVGITSSLPSSWVSPASIRARTSASASKNSISSMVEPERS